MQLRGSDACQRRGNDDRRTFHASVPSGPARRSSRRSEMSPRTSSKTDEQHPGGDEVLIEEGGEYPAHRAAKPPAVRVPCRCSLLCCLRRDGPDKPSTHHVLSCNHVRPTLLRSADAGALGILHDETRTASNHHSTHCGERPSFNDHGS